MRRPTRSVFVFSGSSDGKTLFMDRVSVEKKSFTDLLESGLRSYEFTPRSPGNSVPVRAIIINGKRYCL